MTKERSVYIALPVLNEFRNLPKLLSCLKEQSIQKFTLVVCVNQYESWWETPDKVSQCLDNQKSIEYLKAQKDLVIEVLDKSSKGNGWSDKKGGVGWARKIAMDFINQHANSNDLIVCMDADTYYPVNYLESIVKSFDYQPNMLGLAIPYYHEADKSETGKLILRYEIYMRNYLINMLKIDNPYAYTALGSAMVVPVWAYKKVGGITPVKSGEDFYFLQKLIKTGEIGIWVDVIAFPSARFSSRVLFGTGPALIKGNTGDWSSYPIYPKQLFDTVKETFEMFPKLFDDDFETPMDNFLKKQFNTHDLWTPLRNNYPDINNFVRACMIKVDGLRILQFLKREHQKMIDSDLLNDQNSQGVNCIENLDFDQLSALRNRLFDEEQSLRFQKQLVGMKTA